MVLFGQIVIGPPGAGKTTFCHGMKLYMEAIGRNCAIINLDFANDILPYVPAVDVRELMALEDVMEEHELGPNGSLVYCMESLLVNHEWLLGRIEEVVAGVEGQDEADRINYLIFDCPGQVELYTHYTCVQELLHSHLEKKMDIRLCCVHLIDSVHCCSSTTFLAAVLLVAMTMLRLALPHISVLSKVDLLSRQYKDSCPFNLDFYTECMDLNPLTRFVDRPFNPNYDHNNEDSDDESNTEVAGAEHEAPPVGPRPASSVGIRRFEEKHREMTAGLCDLLTDYGMVSFSPCSIEDGEMVGKVLESIDKCNGYSMTVSQADYIVANHMNANRSAATGAGAGTVPAAAPAMPGTVHQDTEPTFFKSIHVMERFERAPSSTDASDSLGTSGGSHAVNKATMDMIIEENM